jgi:ACS family hexuronate transporter-like MFS transporter
MVWIVGWFSLIRTRDLAAKPSDPVTKGPVWKTILSPRFAALLVIVVAINTSWQLLRAWLQLFLADPLYGRGYSEADARYFNSAFYIAADAGCLIAGATVGVLTRRGWDGHRARVLVFGFCAALSTLTTVAAYLPKSPLLLGTLLVVAGGTLGLFPCYYSFTQDLGKQHVGKISGLLASLGWLISAPTHKWFGREIDATHSYDLGIAFLGWAPLVGFVAMLLLWRRSALRTG